MGLIERALTLIFGGGKNALAETVEVFRVNSENADSRASDVQMASLKQLAAEFERDRQSWYDRFIDGLNRLPRPALALGTLGLFVSAMVDPIWFAERMQGIALVPEPLWWLLGAIVSFYFGARHQAKGQAFQRSVAAIMAHTPQVVENIGSLRALSSQSPGVARTEPDATITLASVESGDNAALEDWRRSKA